MNMFGEFQLKITPGSAKMVIPIFVKIPKNGGFTKMMNFHFSGIFHLAETTSLENANCEKWRHESKNSVRGSV